MSVLLAIIVIKTNKVVFIKGANLEYSLSSKLGDSYYSMYDYKYLKLPSLDYSIVFPRFYNASKFSTPSFNGTEEEILQQAIEYVKEFDYTKFTSNPEIMNFIGEGNCQALSLTFKGILDKYNINSELVGTDTHVLNEVTLDDKVYVIDFSNGSVFIKD